MAERLSVHQERALHVLKSEHPYNVCEEQVWEGGVPFPRRTMNALVARGLVVRLAWLDEEFEFGYEYRLAISTTDAERTPSSSVLGAGSGGEQQ